MPIHEWNAVDFLKNHRTWIRFNDQEITNQIRKGRLAANDLLYVKGPPRIGFATIMRMSSTVVIDDILVIEYSITRTIYVSPHHRWVSTLLDLVELFSKVGEATTKPRVVFLAVPDDVLQGFRVKKLDQLISDFLSNKVAVITNWSVIAHLSTVTVPTLPPHTPTSLRSTLRE